MTRTLLKKMSLGI